MPLDIDEFNELEEDNTPVKLLAVAIDQVFPVKNHEFGEVKALERLNQTIKESLPIYRPLLSTSVAQFGREYKIYGQARVPSEDKETGEVKFITVKKIIGTKLIRHVARNDRDKYFILRFDDDSEEQVDDCKFMKMTVLAHKENQMAIRKRFLDIDKFYENNCVSGSLAQAMRRLTK